MMEYRAIIIKLIGVVIFIDGMWSMLTKKNNHQWLLDAGRVVRTMIGCVLYFI